MFSDSYVKHPDDISCLSDIKLFANEYSLFFPIEKYTFSLQNAFKMMKKKPRVKIIHLISHLTFFLLLILSNSNMPLQKSPSYVAFFSVPASVSSLFCSCVKKMYFCHIKYMEWLIHQIVVSIHF